SDGFRDRVDGIRFAAERRAMRGLGAPETFDFLGFTHVCRKARSGNFLLVRRTMRVRMWMLLSPHSAMDEAKLREKLAKIEALFAGATTEGERVAAGEVRRRIQERLESAEQAAPAIDYKFSLADAWSRKVFMALLRRYNLKPFRYRGQRRTTVMVKVPKAMRPSFSSSMRSSAKGGRAQ
ncbi:MAG TPA: hypothetical protein VF316_18410, partial [Polyangiaceae bacterium]